MKIKKQKIALVSRRFDKNCGSAEWIYADWLLKQLRSRNFEVFPIEQKTATITSSSMAKMGYDFFVLPFRLMRCRIFKNAKVFHFLGENQAINSWIVKALGAKSLAECYDIMRVKNRKFSMDKMYFLCVYRMLRFNNKIIAISSSTKNDLNKTIGIEKDKISTIYPIYREIKPIKTAKKGRFTIGYLGALGGRKRTELFLKLAEKINGKNMVINIWGGGKNEALANGSKKFKEEINLKGFAPENEIEKIYNSFDVFVFPSAYEGFGLPIIEAMMAGKPCFILKDADIPDEVRNGCIVCKNMNEVADKIDSLDKNKKAYSFASEKAFIYSKKFSAKENLDKLIKLYGL